MRNYLPEIWLCICTSIVASARQIMHIFDWWGNSKQSFREEQFTWIYSDPYQLQQRYYSYWALTIPLCWQRNQYYQLAAEWLRERGQQANWHVLTMFAGTAPLLCYFCSLPISPAWKELRKTLFRGPLVFGPTFRAIGQHFCKTAIHKCYSYQHYFIFVFT